MPRPSVLRCSPSLSPQVEEEPRRVRDVINILRLVRIGELLRSSREYWALKESLVRHEQLVLRALAFDTAVHTPHDLASHYLLALRANRGVCELTAAILNDTMGATDGLPPRIAATAAIALASAMLSVRLPERWWLAFDVQESPATLASRRAGPCAPVLPPLLYCPVLSDLTSI